MAKSPSYKINIDTGNLKQVIAYLDNLSKSEGKVGQQAEKLLEPTRSLLASIESGAKVTKSQLQSVRNTLSGLSKDIEKTYTDYNKQLEEASKNLEDQIKLLNEMKGKKKFSGLWDEQTKSFKKDFVPEQPVKKSKEELFKEAKNTILKNNPLYQKNPQYFDYYNTANYNTANLRTGPKLNEEENARRILLSQLIEKYRALQDEENARFENLEKKWKKDKKDVEDALAAYEKYEQQIKDINEELGKNSGDVPKVTSGLGQVQNELTNAEINMDITGQTQATYQSVQASPGFNKMTKSLLRSGIVLQAFKKLVHESAKAISELDDAITNMTVVTGESRKETEAYVDSFAKIAQATSSTITEIADLTTEFVRQGRSVADAMTLAEETAKAAKIAGISVRDSLTYMTSAINGFNLAAEDAAHVSDVFAKLAAESATDYNQLAVALSKVSAQANQAGMSMEYTTALLAKGIETTQEAPESIGTALKTIIARFRELSDYGVTLEDGMDVNKVEKALNAVGISLRDETGAFRDLSDVLNELGPMWDDLNTMQRQAIAQAAAGTRQQSRFLAIMQDWERTMELVDTAQNAAGASAAQYSKYAKGMTASLTNFKSAYQSVVTGLVDSDWIIGLVDAGTGLLNTLNGILNATGNFIPIILTGIAAIAGKNIIMSKIEDHRLAQLEKELLATKATNKEQKNAAEGRIQQEKERIQALRSEQEARLKLKAQEELMGKLERKNNAESAEALAEEEYKKAVDHKKELERIRAEAIAEKNKQILNEKDETKKKALQAELQKYTKNTANIKKANEAIAEADKAWAAAKAETIAATNEYNAAVEESNALIKEQLKPYDEQLTVLDKLSEKYSHFGGTVIGTFKKILNSKSFKEFFNKKTTNAATDAVGKAAESATKVKKTGVVKNFFKTNASSIKAGAIAAGLIITTTLAIQQITKLVKAEEEALNNIAELTSENADKTAEIANLQKLQDEYNALRKKVNLTTEETERLRDIEKELADTYDLSLGNDANAAINDRIRDLSGEIGKNTEEAMVEAFKAAALKGEKIFDNADFSATITAQLQSGNKSYLSENSAAHSEIYNSLANSFDASGYAKDAMKRHGDGTADDNWAGIAAGAGATGAGLIGAGIAAGVAGVALLSNPIGWAILAIGAIGGVAAGIAAKTHEAGKDAKETAEKVALELATITDDFNKYSAEMSEVATKSLAEQFAKHQSTLAQITNEYSREAIEASQSIFTTLEKLGVGIKELNKMQLIKDDGTFEISNEAMNNLINQANELGEKGATAFVETWKAVAEKGVSSTELATVLSVTLAGGSKEDIVEALVESGVSRERATQIASGVGDNAAEDIKADYEERKATAEANANKVNAVSTSSEASMDEYLMNELGYDKKTLKKMRVNEKRAIIEGEQKRYNEEVKQANDALDNLQEAVYDLITPIGDILTLTQALTAMDSATKNAQEFADRLEEGTTTLEDWSNAASQYADLLASEEWANATAEEKADMIRNSNNIFSTADRRNEQINKTQDRTELEHNNRIDELEEELAAAESEEEKARIQKLIDEENKAIAAERAVYDQLRSMYDVMTEAQAVQEANTRALTHLDKQIEKGNLLAYDRKNDILASNLAASTSKMNRQWQNWADNDYFKSGKHDLEKWQKAVQDMYNGNAEAYLELMGTLQASDQEVLKNMYENYAEYQAEIDEINEQITQNILDQQDAAIEAYKQKMEREYNETKESLDKRKELYEKYFDAIDKEAEEDDYESERSRLLNAIGSLSTSTDMASLNKRKELEKELADLEKERRETDRDELRDNVMERIEEQQSEFDKIYEEATENNRAIWQQFVALGEESMEAILQLMKDNAGFDNMTFEQQWAFLQNHTNLTDSVDDWIANAGSTYSAEAMKGMNLDQQKAQMIQDFTREYSNVFGDFNFQIDASQVTGTTPEEIARSIFDVFRKEMSKRGITANQKK